ncbi:MAG TPA: hypothetical protein VMX97_03500, partial [Hyphomicrobiaceae bacterium]|nr:hypothetical protein [Hyphomicrobiaceae bacterium]
DPNIEGLCVWAAYQPKGAANLAASYVDLSGNGNNTGPGVAPTWDAVNGWEFNGTTQYLLTAFIAQSDQSQSMIVQGALLNTNANYICGSREIAVNYNFRLSLYYSNLVSCANGGAVTVAPGIMSGNIAVAGNQGYRNGAPQGGAIGGWAGASTTPVVIGALNKGGVIERWCKCYVYSFALYDCILTAPQVAAVAAAMAAL